MWRVTLCVFVGVMGLGFVSCSITCPDGKLCPDLSTCCATKHGYACCHYPKAVCCSDMAHCCPSGFQCNLVTQTCERKYQPWMNVPMLKKVAAEEPSESVPPVSPLQKLDNSLVPDQAEQNSSVVRCDSYYVCPDHTTCCRHPKGAWFCCPYYLGRCCLDGIHCCPHGLDCDLTYQHCVRQGLTYPFSPRQAASAVPATLISTKEDDVQVKEKQDESWMDVPALNKVAAEEPSESVPPVSPLQKLDNSLVPDQAEQISSVVRCDSYYVCPDRTTCCRHPKGAWFCCPYYLGRCCLDGIHCCPHGLDCDLTYQHCVRQGLTYPFSPRQAASAVPATLISTKEDEGKVQETPMTALTETSGGAPETAVIRCDAKTYCPAGRSCCMGPSGQWGCCPYQLGQCCKDGVHCCQYGYTCDASSLKCKKGYSQIPSGSKEDAKQD
uniref:Progranulin-like n=1 Tax=Myripristis murdjan TaxID=586833 RepID=A0A667YFZ0_9TELE